MPGLTLCNIESRVKALRWCLEDADIQFDPPLSEPEVLQWEREHLVRLPAAYRFFITQIGNGSGNLSNGPAREGLLPLNTLPKYYPFSQAQQDENLRRPFPSRLAYEIPEAERIEAIARQTESESDSESEDSGSNGDDDEDDNEWQDWAPDPYPPSPPISQDSEPEDKPPPQQEPATDDNTLPALPAYDPWGTPTSTTIHHGTLVLGTHPSLPATYFILVVLGPARGEVWLRSPALVRPLHECEMQESGRLGFLDWMERWMMKLEEDDEAEGSGSEEVDWDYGRERDDDDEDDEDEDDEDDEDDGDDGDDDEEEPLAEEHAGATEGLQDDAVGILTG